MLFDIFLTLILVCLNGFFVAAEFALVKVRMPKLEVMAREGNSNAQVTKHILQNLNSYLSACQLGITLASLALGWIGEEVVSELVLRAFNAAGLDVSLSWVHAIAIAIAFLLITTLHIVLGEQAPKYLGIQRPESTGLATSKPLRIFHWLLWPLIIVLNWLSMKTLRLMGIEATEEHAFHSSQELLYIFEEGRSSGVLRQSEHMLLENVVEFYDRPAKHIMIPRTSIVAISTEYTTQEIISEVVKHGFSRFPVYNESIDNIVGLVHEKDMLAMMHNGEADNWQKYMRKVEVVPESKKLGSLLRDFQSRHTQFAIVVDEFGGTSGIVTLEDILEELVGEIQDEYDEELPWVTKIGENLYSVAGQASITDANEHLPVALPYSDTYDTVAGYILELFGRVPNTGDQISTLHYKFTVREKSKHQIRHLEAEVLPAPSAETEEEG